MDSSGSDTPRVNQLDLELININKSFGNNRVLDNLSLDIYRGELCCLLGPSGCGKTTTLNIINGLLEPDAGKVILNGEDITNLPPQRRNLGMVFQNYALFPHMDVFDNIAYGLRRRHWPQDRISPKVSGALQLVRLDGYEKRRPHELSGGQQQRIALARALVIEPGLWLLDEPLSNLDARLRADMREEIRRIQRTLNITTIYVTHDQEEAMSIADRIVLMNRGVIEQIGSPKEVYEEPQTRFAADFIGRVNMIPGNISNKTLTMLGQQFLLETERWPAEAEVTCALRPEQVKIVKPGTSLLSGTIEHITYLGSIVLYRLRVQETNIILEAELSGPAAKYQPGDVIGLDFQVEDLQIFPDNPRPESPDLV